MRIKSIKLIFIYRSILFKKIKFKTDNKDLKDIVKALNIKNKRDRIAYVYDEAVKVINKYYSKDLCQFKDGKCIAQRNNDNINGCCRLCHLVTDKGCPSVNLPCKLIYCKSALGNMRLLKFNDIKILKCLSLSQRLVLRSSFFMTREQIIDDMCHGILISTIRNIFKTR